MAHKYYFLNGKTGHGKALFLPENDQVVRDFKDISNIDLITLGIKKGEKADFIKQYNPDEVLEGVYYNASFPHSITDKKTGIVNKNSTIVYPAMFDFSSEKTEYYIDKLKEYAEERKWKVQNEQQVKLDDTPGFSNFIENFMYQLFDSNDYRIADPESLIAYKLKEIITERYETYPDLDTSNYVKSRLNIIKNILTNYTQLRLLILEYLSIKEVYRYKLRNTMANIETWKNEDMSPAVKDIKKKEEYRQLVLSDFIDINPKTK